MPTLTADQAYQQFKIMPSLQLHQLRVTGVAELICRAFPDLPDRAEILSACLVHDMGNIIKFDLARFPEFLEPEGLHYWQVVKDEFHQKYGDDEHQASLQIAREIGVSERTLALIDAIGYEQVKANFDSKDLSKMICEYADDRVAPMAVVSLTERIADLYDRYKALYPGPEHEERRKWFALYAQKCELYIFASINLRPSDITDEAVSALLTDLRSFPLI